MEENRKDMIDSAETQHRKLLKKYRRSKNNDALLAKLITRFRAAREKGRMVSFAWIYTHANIIQKELKHDSARLSPGVVVCLLNKFKSQLRRAQRKKQSRKLSTHVQ